MSDTLPGINLPTVERAHAVAKAGRGELGAGDHMPPGPYLVGLTHTQRGDSPPWTVCCADGGAVAGHVPSLECARAIVAALNGGAAAELRRRYLAGEPTPPGWDPTERRGDDRP